MFLKELLDLKDDIVKISEDKSVVSEEVKTLLNSEATSHNIDKIVQIVRSYFRNR